ncbi:site-specific integrase [Rhodococcus olei]|uniref:Site-specific integrase n=1 Tax=Rhodococcus olei TaxID=2161675 RepID=A0ABP8NY61_9NOCA
MAKRAKRSFGGLRQLPSGRWQANYTAPDGLLYKAPRTFAAEDDAVAWLAAERRKIDLDVWRPPAVEAASAAAPVTLRTYSERWLAERHLKPRTRSLYEGQLRLHILPDLGDAELTAITAAVVRSWHAGLGTATPTRNAHCYSLLHAILATAVDDELIAANPCRVKSAMTAKRRKTITVLSAGEISALAEEMPPGLRASVLVAGWCSLRWGELTELRRKDVDPEAGIIHVRRAVTYRSGVFTVDSPKTAAGVRDVAIPPHVIPAIVQHLDRHVQAGRDALLFPGVQGGHLGDYAYRKAFKPAAARIGRPELTPHMLRHSAAVLAAQAGGTTAELMARLGHTTPAMALRYQHVAAGRDRQIAERLSSMVEMP